MQKSLPLLLAFTAFAAGPEWPQFRGPAASGVSSAAAPTEWDGPSGKNILWKTPIPGLAHSSPVISGDHIYLTSAIPESGDPALKVGLYGDIKPVEGEGSHAFVVFAVNRKSGKILWRRTATSGLPKIKRHPKSTHANPTPATDGKYIVVFFGSEGLYCYDRNGKLIWKKHLGTLDSGFFRAPEAQWGFASSPIIHNGKVIIQADIQKDSFLAAFDLPTGKQLWKTARAESPTWSTPAVFPYGAKQQIVLNGWKHIGGYDLETGAELWRLAGGGDLPVPTPIMGAGLILITNAHGSQRPIYAIRPTAKGDITGSTEFIAWSHDRAGNYMQTPLAHDGLGYFCYDNGVLTVYDLRNGERLYQHRLGSGTTGFSSSPVAAAGNLYITSEDGTTHVIALGRDFREIKRNDLGETVMSTPALAGGILYIRARQHLFAIGHVAPEPMEEAPTPQR
jgi:outer membrane protein assembly factor BamB